MGSHKPGGSNAVALPDTISNSVVKRRRAEDTCLERDRENR